MVCKNEDCHTPETNCPCTIIDQCECPTLKEVVETLAHYKELEEQGKLIEQKHGQWDYNKYRQMYCSNCGQYPEIAVEWNYCPNCGAKMEE